MDELAATETVPNVEACATARSIGGFAARLFAERGFDATPVRAIAEAAGVTCPTLYYHFGSKEGLAQALLVRPLLGQKADLDSLLNEPLGVVERLVEAVGLYFRFTRDDPDRARFLWAVCFGPLGGGLGSEVNRLFAELTASFGQIAGRLADEGLVARNDVPELVLALRGQIVIRAMDFLYRGGALEPDSAERVVLSTLQGFAKPGARPRRDDRPASPERQECGPHRVMVTRPS